MGYEVFISYSHKNKDIADALCENLEKDNIRCWYAPRDIRPGAVWAEEIISSIETVKVLIVIVTEDSIRSARCSARFPVPWNPG